MATDQKGICEIPENLARGHQLQFKYSVDGLNLSTGIFRQ